MSKIAPAKRHRKNQVEVLLLLGVRVTQLMQGIMRYSVEAGWELEPHHMMTGSIPPEWNGDGILGLITQPSDYEALQHYMPRPMVDFSAAWVHHLPKPMRKSGIHIPRVLLDYEAIGRMAGQYLMERGFKNLATFNVGNFWFEVPMIGAFRDTVEAAGARFHEIKYCEQFDFLNPRPDQTHRKADLWLVDQIRSLPKPLAIFAGEDGYARRIIRLCSGAGIMVPDEVAVLGTGNDPMVCDLARIPVSSVDVSWETVGYEGSRLLDRAMAGKPAPEKPLTIAPVGVVTRMSTNVMAVPHPKVARALRYIWEHHMEPIQTADVARAVGLSRKVLYRAFKRHLGRDVSTEIIHCRIERAKKLLLETRLKAHEIAEQAGFSGMVHFSRSFLQHAGMRPSHFRRLYAGAGTEQRARDSKK